jgi:cation:H+ antiporter
MTALLLVAGLVALVAGGEVLVRGASTLARVAGLSPLVVGLTVVSFATSAPELAVTVQATLGGSPGIAVGNVLGSNVANILLVVGTAGLILPLAVQLPVVRRDVPVLIALSLLFWVQALDGAISTLDGIVLVALLLAYTAWTVVRSRRNPDEAPVETAAQAAGGAADGEAAPPQSAARRLTVAVVLVALGVVLLVAGANWLVSAASDIAAALGLSEMVIGLTVVAIGTSLPELATSVVAAVRGDIQMAVGNAVGSCIFNLGAVMGLTALVAPEGVPVAASALAFDIPVMVAVVVALLPIAFTGFTIARWEAGLFVAYYGAYVAYLLLDSAGHEALPRFNTVMLWFVLPITAVTLVLLATYEVGVIRGRRLARREAGLPEDEAAEGAPDPAER